MTDRELLELAAKAAGMKIDTHYVDGGASVWAGEPHNSDWTPDWSPLTDDGDALRLAVKKGIFTEHHELFLRLLREELAMDCRPSEATRRAIVRAAAEIGRAMT